MLHPQPAVAFFFGVSQRARSPRVALAVVAAAVLLAACGKKEEGGAGGAPGGGMPPATVGVVAVQPQAVGLVTELPGRLEASRVAEVRARAAGILQKRLFREGSDVRAGQPLFEIDAAPYEAALASAQASLARAEANVAQTKAQAERYKPLVEANAISKQDYANAVAAQKAAEAEVAAGRAAVQTAQINLNYADVTAPISGRIGRALVTEGALVTAQQASALTTIQQLDPIYVDVTQSTTDLLRLRRELASGQIRKSGDNAAQVKILLEDGSTYERTGKLEFTGLSVDTGTGMITLRAVVPNPDGVLLPGAYVRAVLEEGVDEHALLVPQKAVSRDQTGAATALVLGADGKVQQRLVTVARAVGNNWWVSKGLQQGDKLIVDGFQWIGDGAPVQPVEAKINEDGIVEVTAAPAAAPVAQP